MNGFSLRADNLQTVRNTSASRPYAFAIALGAISMIPLMAQAPSDWPMFGKDVTNTAATQTTGNSMSPSQVAKLKPKWVFTTGGDVSARAAVVNGVAYFPDWAGNIWAVDAQSGALIWSHKLSDYGLTTGTVSRTSPAVANGLLYLGTQYTRTGKTGGCWRLGPQPESWPGRFSRIPRILSRSSQPHLL